jgi:hypothetical protein
MLMMMMIMMMIRGTTVIMMMMMMTSTTNNEHIHLRTSARVEIWRTQCANDRAEGKATL